MMEDISYYATITENRGEFIDFLTWFPLTCMDYPNEKVNEQNLDVYYEHMLKCVDRFVKDARAGVVMKDKINQSWSFMRTGDRHNAIRIIQQAGWVIECPDQVEELRQRDH